MPTPQPLSEKYLPGLLLSRRILLRVDARQGGQDRAIFAIDVLIDKVLKADGVTV